MLRPGSEHLVLVDAQGPDPVQTPRVVDQGLTVTTDGGHGPVPGDPEPAGGLGHAVAVLAHRPADLGRRPGGSARPPWRVDPR